MRALLRGGPGHDSTMEVEDNADRIEIDVFEINGQRVEVRAVYRFAGSVAGDDLGDLRHGLLEVAGKNPIRIFVFSGTVPLAGHGRGEL